MRLLKITLLAAALLVFGAATSSAFRVDMQSSSFGGPAINVGDLVTIDVVLDTEGGTGITLIGVGVLFDESVFTYRQDLSSSTSYLLYTNAKSAYLVPDPSCVGSCGIYPLRSNQVQVGFLSNKLPNGVPASTQTDVGVLGPRLAQLVFQAVGSGTGIFTFDFDSFYGSILQLGDLTNPPLVLGADGQVVVPEPTTALLVGLGLVGLGVAGRRR